MKKQQIVLHIGGGVSKANYLNIIPYLISSFCNFSFQSKKKKWSHFYEDNLGSGYKVIKLKGKDKYYADYEIWKKQFEKIVGEIDKPQILVGHSLGGTFLLKYLNENAVNFQISKIFLIAPGFKDSEKGVLGNFSFDQSLENFEKYEKITKIYHSKDDSIVPFSDFEDITKKLPNVGKQAFEDRGHFIGEDFPEIYNDIKSF